MGTSATALELPDVEVSPETNLMVIYTSGTTGLPKGINNNHLKLCATGIGVSMQAGLGSDDVAYVSKGQELFTSEHGVRPGNPAKFGLIDEGEPRHAQLRKLVNRGFTPRMVKKLESVFRDLTSEAIDAVFADPQVRERGMRIELYGIASVRGPCTISGAQLALDHPSPRKGEHG